MARLQETLNYLFSLTVNWELVLRFIEVLIWPTITLIGLAMVRPGRIVAALLDGGELDVGPAKMRFAKRVQEIAASVDEDAETGGEPEVPIANPLEEAADPYTTVLNGWGKVIEGLEHAMSRASLASLDKRNPMQAVLQLRRANLIGRKLERNIQALWDFRNRVVRAGSRRLERLGLTQLQADDYYATADRVRRGIVRAISYRETTGQLSAGTGSQSSNDERARMN